MDEAKAEVLAFTAFPRAHWRKIWSTNPLERVNKEIKRRSRVVGIFPNAAAVIRLVGAVLIDMHDEWIAGDRRYLSEESMARSTPSSDTDTRRHRERRVRHRGSPQSPPPRGTQPSTRAHPGLSGMARLRTNCDVHPDIGRRFHPDMPRCFTVRVSGLHLTPWPTLALGHATRAVSWCG